MFSFKMRADQRKTKTVRPAIESLESRAYFAVTPAPGAVVTVNSAIPPMAIEGHVVNDRFTINIATAAVAARGLVDVQLFASPTQSVPTGATPLVDVLRETGIPAGRDRTLAFRVREFQNFAPGEYYIVAELQGAVDATASSAAQIDLQLPAVTLTPTIIGAPAIAHANVGMLVTISLMNSGNVVARGPLEVAFSASPNPQGTNPFALTTLTRRIAILPGRHAILHFRVPVAVGTPTGNEYIVATVDPNQVFADFSNTTVYQTPVSVE